MPRKEQDKNYINYILYASKKRMKYNIYTVKRKKKTKISLPLKLTFRHEGEIKTFSEKQK